MLISGTPVLPKNVIPRILGLRTFRMNEFVERYSPRFSRRNRLRTSGLRGIDVRARRSTGGIRGLVGFRARAYLKLRERSDGATRRLAESRSPFLRMDARFDVVPERCVPATSEFAPCDGTRSTSEEFA